MRKCPSPKKEVSTKMSKLEKETLSSEEKKEIQKNLKEETEGKIKTKGYVKPRQKKQNRCKDL